ncbi:aldose 1-epimerase family protein [Lactobacillus hominis]|uniref:Galactose mutarotase-like protein n=1 Tax=Lactobacillus hominis DSM 23910 = CRBIP 24.179 TaxID=1423758 RepID=I7L7I4_9LACO|nr:aldose 1-epimerase family protein [Lactobacillus hominis]KRM85091.1 aldose 1-epimerase [Lactobacillus hominis DSM 23910 = CRBIP 24.179]MCT3348488.1 aldose 1-epimerase family protein [Lactobacillus hominis]CCI82657.1 Galactose mutarotase-like protein [Lactobacillus hominis DSM 23910 = CRBIP 24.179]
MDYQIKNSFLTATISDHGAEIQSVKDNNSNREYMWQADPKIWGRHAPVLFPIVGRLKDDQYRYKGQTYHMGQHGFARNMDFSVEEKDDNHITFLLISNEETKKSYPFDFELRVTYTLLNNLLEERFDVTNTGDEEMIFGIGGHPGFNLPTDHGLTKSDYYFKFEPSVDHIRIPLKAPLIDWANRSLVATDSLFEISDLLFKDDAWVFQLKGRNKVSIRTEKSNYHINVKMDNAPFVGLWSQYPQTADYICIEPWWGIADTVDASGNLEDKKGMNKLAPNNTWENGFSIAFHDEKE